MAYDYLSDEVLATVVPIIAFWITCGVYELLDYLLPDSRLHTEEERDKNPVSRWVATKRVLLLQGLYMLLLFFSLKGGGGNVYGIPKPQPSFLLEAWHFIIAMAFTDAWQYFMHRLLHSNRFLYKHVHSSHHALIAPHAIGSFYTHPVDSLILDNVSYILAIMISGMTARTSIFFSTLVLVKSIDLHCGLWLPWSPFQILFYNDVPFHETHHQPQGFHCNFAAPFFITWDKIMGTYMPCSVEKRKEGGYKVRIIKQK